ncbi:MAG: GAF domain-containing protein [Armatimonadetes bacterium]|nr:GAF domain-containing protein [Armatimonadota bacterium]
MNDLPGASEGDAAGVPSDLDSAARCLDADATSSEPGGSEAEPEQDRAVEPTGKRAVSDEEPGASGTDATSSEADRDEPVEDRASSEGEPSQPVDQPTAIEADPTEAAVDEEPTASEDDEPAGPPEPRPDPDRRAEVARRSLQYLIDKVGAERAVVLMEVEAQEQLEVEAVCGFEATNFLQDAPVYHEILRRALREGAPEQMNDPWEYLGLDPDDPIVKATMADSSRGNSAICVPLKSPSGRVIGLLYGDHHQTEAFRARQMQLILAYAREMEARLFPGPPSEPRPRPPRVHRQPGAGAPDSGPEATENKPRRILPVFRPPVLPARPVSVLIPVGLILAAVWVFVGTLMGSHRTERRPPAGIRVVHTIQNADPMIIARTFLRQVQLRRFGEAWQLLSPDLQKKLPAASFASQAEAWLADSTNRWELGYRTVSETARRETTILVQVDPPQKLKGLPVWRWTLQRSPDGWRIVQMEGAPLRP